MLDSGATEFDEYPNKGHFWKKLPNHILWQLASKMTAQADITKLYEFVYYNREYNFPFVGIIDPKTVFLDEKEGVLTFTAYSYIKALAQIPTSWITRAVEIDGEEHQRWLMNIALDNAIRLIWERLRGLSDVQNFSPILNMELESAYTGGMLGFMLNLYEEIDFTFLDATDTSSIDGFSFIGANHLHVMTARYPNDDISEVAQNTDFNAVIVAGDAEETAYSLFYLNSPMQMAYSTPFYLWERQTSLTAQPSTWQVIPAKPTFSDTSSFGMILDCIQTDISAILSKIYYLKEDSTNDRYKLGRATFDGYSDVAGGGYKASYSSPIVRNTGITFGNNPRAMTYVLNEVDPTEPIIYVATEFKVYRLLWESSCFNPCCGG